MPTIFSADESKCRKALKSRQDFHLLTRFGPDALDKIFSTHTIAIAKISQNSNIIDKKQMQIMSNTQNETQNKRYRRKYKFIKIRIKSLLLENAALCDEVAKIQESILIVKEERKFLLRKLLEYESDPDMISNQRQECINTTNGPRAKIKKRCSFDDTSKI